MGTLVASDIGNADSPVSGGYISVADMREDTLAEFAANLALTTSEADDTDLALTIVRLSTTLNDYTNDVFTSESLTLTIDGSGGPRLFLPKRCTALTSVKLVDDAGTVGSAISSSVYRLHSSLYSAGSKRLGEFDWVDLVPFSAGLTGGPSNTTQYLWPEGPQNVQVVGTFGWTTCPGDIQRALALMVYHHFKPEADIFRNAVQVTDSGTTYTLGPGKTGLRSVDEIIEEYRRDSFLGVA